MRDNRGIEKIEKRMMRKKRYIDGVLLVVLGVLLAGCVSDNLGGGEEKNGMAVSFGGNTGGVTRGAGSVTRAAGGEAAAGGVTRAAGDEAAAGGVTRAAGDEAAALLGNAFMVYGSKAVSDAEKQVVFPGYVVRYQAGTEGTTESNSSGWEYVGVSGGRVDQTIKYWDYGAQGYYYAAYSVGRGDGSGQKASAVPVMGSNELESVSFTGSREQLATCYVTNRKEVTSAAYRQAVTLSFFALTSNIRVGLYETIPGHSVKDVRFYTSDDDVDATGTAVGGVARLYADSETLAEGGTLKVTYAADGKAGLTFQDAGYATTSIVAPGALGNYAGKEKKEPEGAYLGRTSNTSTYTAYQTVLPNAAGTALKLKVDYTIVSIDKTGQETRVKGATAIVPAAYTMWKSNYAYTYIFKISDNTNGYTGDPGSGAGLYPITFDAWAAADVGDTQGTTTTFGTYSITTHQEDDVQGDDVVYKAGKKIDITVMLTTNDAKMALDGTTKKVRIVRQVSNNESDVEKDYGDREIAADQITYSDGKATFTPPMEGYYRVEYWDNGNMLAVKIVKVGEADISAASLQADEEVDEDYRHVRES